MSVIQTSHGGQLPEGAVRMSEKEVNEILWDEILHWRSGGDKNSGGSVPAGDVVPGFLPDLGMAPIQYGFVPILATALGSAGLITAMFRRSKLFFLGETAKKVTYVAAMGMTGLATGLVHALTLQDIVHRKTACAVCLQSRVACTHAVLGCAYPAILAPLACLTFSVRITGVGLDVRRTATDCLRLVRKRSALFWTLMAVNCAVGVGVTHLQQDAAWRLHHKIQTQGVRNGSVAHRRQPKF